MSLIKARKHIHINNLGERLSRFANLEADNILRHEDVSAWGAPGECHQDVHKGFEKDWANLEKEIGSFDSFMKEARKRGFGCVKGYDHAVARIASRNSIW